MGSRKAFKKKGKIILCENYCSSKAILSMIFFFLTIIIEEPLNELLEFI